MIKFFLLPLLFASFSTTSSQGFAISFEPFNSSVSFPERLLINAEDTIRVNEIIGIGKDQSKEVTFIATAYEQSVEERKIAVKRILSQIEGKSHLAVLASSIVDSFEQKATDQNSFGNVGPKRETEDEILGMKRSIREVYRLIFDEEFQRGSRLQKLERVRGILEYNGVKFESPSS